MMSYPSCGYFKKNCTRDSAYYKDTCVDRGYSIGYTTVEMSESYSVAVLGSQDYCYGIQVFDLTVDQICSLLEKPDEKGVDHKKLGAEPYLTCQVMGGGRYFPSHSRKEIAETMQGVEILIAVFLTEPDFLYYARNFYSSLIEKNVMDECSMVIARIVDNSIHANKSDTDLKTVMHRYLGTNHGDFTEFENLRIISDAASEGVSQELALLRAALAEEELREMVTQPVKETLSAGKVLLDAGQRLSGWIGSHIKTTPAA